MVEPVQELIGANFNTPLIFQKEDRVQTVGGSIARRKSSERRVSLNHQGTYPIERRDIFRKQA
jgi:hypothetical protein